MATFSKRYGWKWSESERASRQGALSELRRTAARVASQVSLIERYAPEYFEQARTFGCKLAQIASSLQRIELRRSHHRKYQPLSPADVDAAFSSFQETMRAWHMMTSAPHYQTLVRAANKVTRRENAKIREQNRLATALLNRCAEIQEEELRKLWAEMESLFEK